MIEVSTRKSGPVFNGRAAAAAHAFTDAAAGRIAEVGDNMVHAELGRVLRNPTGFYESRVHTERVGYAEHRVTDSNVVYGPWLEGTGSRNRTTRFKGYFTFRRTAQALQTRAASIANTVLPPYLRRMR